MMPKQYALIHPSATRKHNPTGLAYELEPIKSYWKD